MMKFRIGVWVSAFALLGAAGCGSGGDTAERERGVIDGGGLPGGAQERPTGTFELEESGSAVDVAPEGEPGPSPRGPGAGPPAEGGRDVGGIMGEDSVEAR